MEFRCTQCQAIGPASAIRPAASGVELVCGSCGAANPLQLDPSASPPDPGNSAPAAPRPTRPQSAPMSEKDKDMVAWVRDHALEKLLPDASAALRCRKCAAGMDADDEHCRRCGLSTREAFRYPEGQAPWEVPARGKEQEHERAELLWQALLARWERDDAREPAREFVRFVRDSDLLDLGIRKLRFRLVDTPRDPLAMEMLTELAEALQRRVVVAKAEAQASAKEFHQEVLGLRKNLVIISAVAWIGVFLFFTSVFWQSCH